MCLSYITECGVLQCGSEIQRAAKQYGSKLLYLLLDYHFGRVGGVLFLAESKEALDRLDVLPLRFIVEDICTKYV